MFNFEKLEVWHKAIAFSVLIYDTTKKFPETEKFGLTNQMRRASVSISSNLAEGCSRTSKADFQRFIEIATGSAFEVVSQATIARRQGWLAPVANDHIYESALELVRMLSGLRRSLKA